MKLILFHGTSAANAKQIAKEGFAADKKYNWKVKSKKGFVYLSSTYAPFYAMASANSVKLALIKVEVNTEDCYPEDDFIMASIGKPHYSQKDLDEIDLEIFKHLWEESFKRMGNIAAKPDKIKILGIKTFDGKHLLYRCDPAVSPINFMIMGKYYEDLSNWIFEGNEIMKFKTFMHEELNKLKLSNNDDKRKVEAAVLADDSSTSSELLAAKERK